MQSEYLDRLSESVRQLVLHVEEGAGVEIRVVPDSGQNDGGTTGQGNLAINIQSQRVRLFAPTNDYFPDGAVRHEVLHVRRFHVEGVPKLALADDAPWNKAFSDAMGALDNAIEHVIIVPEELRLNPERRQHWEMVMQGVCAELPCVPEGELLLAVCLHWVFIKHVLPDSPLAEFIQEFMEERGLFATADIFAEQFLSVIDSKEEIVRLIFQSFPDIPKSRAALEYISSTRGTIQTAIP